jgi:hypothetical protein
MTSLTTRPPKPTDYKHGDIHEPTGKIIRGYVFQNGGWALCFYSCTTKLDAHIEIMYRGSLKRAKEEGLPFDIDIEFLKSIRTDHCPILGMELSWGTLGGQQATQNSPSLDKIIPEYGYIKGNVCIISNLANTVKQNVGYDVLYKIADWLHDKTKEVKQNVTPEQLACIPKKADRKIRKDSKRWAVLTARIREDNNNPNHHSRTVQGQDADHRAQTGGGDGMGAGNQKVESSQTSFCF